MTNSADNPIAPILQAFVQPWHDALADPPAAQERVLANLLRIYASTEYGRGHGSEKIGSIAEYRAAFPVKTYADYEPLCAGSWVAIPTSCSRPSRSVGR